jgi:hypothetical protein
VPAASWALIGAALMYQGVPRQDVGGFQAGLGEEVELAFGGLVVVLDREEARASCAACLRARVAQHGEGGACTPRYIGAT